MKQLIIVGENQGSLSIPKLLKLSESHFSYLDSCNTYIDLKEHPIFLVNLCDRHSGTCSDFLINIEPLQSYEQEILEKDGYLLLFCGISECFMSVEDYKAVCSVLSSTVPTLYHHQKFTFVVDSTSFIQKEVQEYFQATGISYVELPGFRNLAWGIPENQTALSVFLTNILSGLRANVEEQKIFVRIRRPDDLRKRLIYEILRDPILHTNCIFTYNMGSEGKPYNSEDPLQIAFNRLESAYDQKENGGFFTHEYNFYRARKDFFLEIVAENSCFITEKTYKPMLLGLPCFYLGPKNMIKQLHDQGFQTFDRWWDESYDDLEMEDPKKLDNILKQVKNIILLPKEEKTKIYLQMYDVLEHNVVLLGERSFEVQNLIDIYLNE